MSEDNPTLELYARELAHSFTQMAEAYFEDDAPDGLEEEYYMLLRQAEPALMDYCLKLVTSCLVLPKL